jgi:hypothetical protein
MKTTLGVGKVLVLQDPDELAVNHTLHSLTDMMHERDGPFPGLRMSITIASLQEEGSGRACYYEYNPDAVKCYEIISLTLKI